MPSSSSTKVRGIIASPDDSVGQEFVTLAAARFGAERDDRLDTLRKITGELEEGFFALVQRERRSFLSEKGDDELLSLLQGEILRLRSTRQVIAVSLERGILSATTSELWCDQGRDKPPVPIGVMQIRIRLDGRKFGVSVRNLTKTLDIPRPGMLAPLIPNHGRVFNPQVLQALPALIGRFAFEQIVTMVIRSIERPDASDPWSVHIPLWATGEAGTT